MIRPLLWLPLAALSFGSVQAEDASLETQARELHALAGGEWCKLNDGFVPEGEDYSSWTFTYKPGWSEDADEETVTLIRIFCMSGAYNINHAYYIHRDFEGLTPLSFAMPMVDPQYEADDFEGKLLEVPVTGMSSALVLVNSDYDPDTKTITSYSKWRGIGDASSSGTWEFREGEFVLVRYDVDASYDGEINPETVLDYTDKKKK